MDVKDSKIFVAKSAFEAADADAVLVMTDWEEFKYLDWARFINLCETGMGLILEFV